ncbi:uncharacterized protein LOC118802854 [Colossoma macropomum]|uniref:uncharacterized protein LOC118802854 n=1 Tax=Colossoma macropomum TaxID=42526 RepID=UPI0018645EF7|nr:uncharacterized protein LOC118802854 [Colossoma macropomum]
MAKLLTVFILQLLIGTFRLCLLQRTLADLRSVHPGENITLHCDITADYEISWYHQSSETMKLKMLVTAERGELDRSFSLSHNVDEGRYEGTEDTSSVSLVIIGVDESDLGLYYCGGRNETTLIQFGRAIRLTFGDRDFQNNSSSAQSDSDPPPDPALYWILIIVLMSVCFISVLMNLIFSWLFCCRVKGKCSSDANADDSIEKDVDLQYASLQHIAVTRGAAQRNTVSDPDSVTYSGIISRPTGQREASLNKHKQNKHK